MNSTNNIAIEAATDGACSGNPGNGGWGGLIILDDGSEIELGGAEKNTTKGLTTSPNLIYSLLC